MADRASAKITVGGCIWPSLIAAFVEVAQGERLSLGWDGELVQEADVEKCAEALESIELGAHEVSGAQFDDLEAFCVKHDLWFVRESDGCAGAWGPERVTFRGGSGEAPKSWVTDDNDNLVITQQELEKLGSYEAALAHFEEGDMIVPVLRMIPTPYPDPVAA